MSALQESQAPRFFEGGKSVVYAGMLGPIIGVIMLIYIQIFGNVDPTYGADLYRVFSFCTSSGIFFITLAALIPFAGFKPKTKKAVYLYIIVSELIFYFMEIVQHLRAVSPRLPAQQTPFNMIVSYIFGVLSLGIIIYLSMIIYGIFRKGSLKHRPIIVLSIRYAFIGAIVGTFSGLWMSVNYNLTGSRELAYQLYIYHGAIFHSLQALPFMAWLLEKMDIQEAARRRLVHVGCLLFNGAVVCLVVQSFTDPSLLFKNSPLMLVFYLFLAAWLVMMAYFFLPVYRKWKSGDFKIQMTM